MQYFEDEFFIGVWAQLFYILKLLKVIPSFSSDHLGSKKILSDGTVNTTWSPVTQWIWCKYRYTYHVHRTARLTTSETLKIAQWLKSATIMDIMIQSSYNRVFRTLRILEGQVTSLLWNENPMSFWVTIFF